MRERPIELPWSCKRSGDCCKSVSQIVMTREEAAEVAHARPDLSLTFYRHLDNRFVYLRGQPCPLLAWDGQLAVCTVWPVRPYNCRRFGCFRPDPHTEPYEPEPLNLPKLRLGCANLSDRLKHRSVRRAYAQMQRKAARWAFKHGWQQDMTGQPVGSNVTFYSLKRNAVSQSGGTIRPCPPDSTSSDQ